MYQLSYISRATDKFYTQHLSELEQRAQANNQRQNITGMLVFDGSHFFQYIEGEKQAIEQLFEKIKNDVRHSAVTELSMGEISQRIFPNWGMKSFLPGDLVASDRVHILDLLSQKHEKESVPEILMDLKLREIACLISWVRNSN